MSKEAQKRLHLIYEIALSVFSCVLAILCIMICYNIYKSKPSNQFTREVVYEGFMKIAVLVFIFIAMVVGGVIINIIYPKEKKKLKGTTKERATLYNLSKKLKAVDVSVADKVEIQRIIRFSMICISVILLVGASVVAPIKVINGYDIDAHNINGQIIKGCFTILTYFSVPLLYLIATALVCKYSVRKELGLIKEAFKNQADAQDKPEGPFTKLTNDLNEFAKAAAQPKKWHKIFSLCVSCTIGIVAVAFIIIGITNGDVAGVLTKAVNICTECIGMG